MKNKNKNVTAEEFEQMFDDGADVVQFADMSKATRPNKVKRVNVDFPLWLVEAIDSEAQRIGVTRQSLIKVWLADRVAQ